MVTHGVCEAPANDHSRLLSHLLLIAIVLVTRVPLIGNFVGEPDSIRFVTGTHLWLAGDHNNQLVFARVISPGYYWFAAHLASATNTPPDSYPLLLTIVSLCAALLMTPALYELGRYIAGHRIALLSAILFLISPAVWWLGIEPHPQLLSMALMFLSLWSFVRGIVIAQSPWWTALCALTLSLSLLIRGDSVLLFPAFLSLVLVLHRWDRSIWRALLWTTGLLVFTSATYLLTRALILDTRVLGQPLRVFELIAPSGITILKQIVPLVMAVGPIMFLFCIVGALLLLRTKRTEELSRWSILLAGWFLPGFLFYVLFPDNLPRHVAIYTLAVIWVGVAGIANLFQRSLASVVTAVAAINFVCVPANSNSAFLMSPNVPMSMQALRAREREMCTMAQDTKDRGGCFVGTYTIPYFLQYVLQAKRQLQPLVGAKGTTSWIKSNDYEMLFQEVSSQPKIEMPCSPAYSLEFTADGRRQRFFGKEVYSSPVWAKLTIQASGHR